MRRRSITGTHHSSLEAVNVVPLIDVVMCLIIFFLIVGKLASERGMAVNLPKAASGREEASHSVLILTIAKAPDSAPKTGLGAMGIIVQVDGKDAADLKAVEAAVFAHINNQPDTSVQVRADRDLSFGVVEPVLRAAGQGGAKSVRLATEKTS
jgi:biopolymer transport protein ExbD